MRGSKAMPPKKQRLRPGQKTLAFGPSGNIPPSPTVAAGPTAPTTAALPPGSSGSVSSDREAGSRLRIRTKTSPQAVDAQGAQTIVPSVEPLGSPPKRGPQNSLASDDGDDGDDEGSGVGVIAMIAMGLPKNGSPEHTGTLALEALASVAQERSTTPTASPTKADAMAMDQTSLPLPDLFHEAFQKLEVEGNRSLQEEVVNEGAPQPAAPHVEGTDDSKAGLASLLTSSVCMS